ncbi:MAG TPA: hypothetical protein VG365_06620 [Solirubrobacteraceae bacterium]|jgi:hypothetical protein|nr:hypothetical protein [Solirubrobacteraceae bacterium]
MREALVDIVERALGHSIRSVMSAGDPSCNLEITMFVLYRWSRT